MNKKKNKAGLAPPPPTPVQRPIWTPEELQLWDHQTLVREYTYRVRKNHYDYSFDEGHYEEEELLEAELLRRLSLTSP